MHLKRIAAPRSWPVERKGSKYIAVPRGDGNGLPLVVAIRDILKLARNKKEVRRAILSENILINNKRIKDEAYSLKLFDVLTIAPNNTNYRVEIGRRGRFKIEPVKERLGEKISKIINKKILRGKITQINLADGRNYLSDLKCRVGDSAVVNFNNNKIEKVIPFEENKEALIFVGKNSGEKGRILKIDKEKVKFDLYEQNKEIEINKKSLIIIK
ncbi:MAG: hypothetical protein AABY22_23120 [Nanoarchaeota archaeon]